jgi:hypothetical protein
VTSEGGFPWDAPARNEHGKQWIEIELDHPVNPWEHEGAGSISWGANLDRLGPLGEEAVSIIKEGSGGARIRANVQLGRRKNRSRSTVARAPAPRSSRDGVSGSNSGSTGSA